MTAAPTPTRTSSARSDDQAADPSRRDRGLLIGLVLATLGGMWLALGLVSFPGGEGWGYDYRAYAEAAVRLDESGTLYAAETLAGPYETGPAWVYYYAPPLGIAVAPLGGLEEEAAIVLWFLLHVAALAAACALMPVPPAVRLAVFGTAALSLAVTRDLVLGNVSVLLLLPLAAAWRWLDRPAGSVAQALAMSVRPMLGVLLIWQLLRRQWRAVAWTIAAGLVLIALSLPFVGIAGYRDYVTVLGNLGGLTGAERNYDLGSTVLGLGLDDPFPMLALVIGYVIGIAAIGLGLRRDREVGFVVTSMASLLLAPILWDHYLAMLALPAALLAARGRPWGLVLPLASWLPPVTLPFVVIAATLLPFAAREPRAPAAIPAPEPALAT